jgi:hypothetical protein
MTELVAQPTDAAHNEDVETQPILTVGSGTQKGLNTDLVTAEGTVAAIEFIAKEYGEKPLWQIQLLVNMAASDWTNGHEDLAMKALTREFDLMSANRVVALLVTTPGTPR